MKKVMILGAGVYQVPLIRKAREMGLYAIVVSIPGNYPGFELADKVYFENTVNYEKILSIAKKEKIDGIVTTGTDVAVITIGKICDALGLKGVSEEGASIACDKIMMKKVFEESGKVNTADFYFADIDGTIEDYQKISEKIGYPVIFKAVDSSGSRGITCVKNASEIKHAYEAVAKVTRQDKFVIEKYLVGEEFGAQAYVQDGKVEFVLPHGDYVYKGDAGVPIGHYAPFNLLEYEDAIYEQTIEAIKAMKLNNCAINADFILCDGTVYVLEIGARGGATQLIELTSLYYGFDYYEKILRVAMGEKVDFSPDNEKRVPNASHLLMSNKSGVIKEIANEVEDMRGICEIQYDYKVGDEIRAFRVGPDRLGHIITVGDTLEEAQRILFNAIDKVKIVVE